MPKILAETVREIAQATKLDAQAVRKVLQALDRMAVEQECDVNDLLYG